MAKKRTTKGRRPMREDDKFRTLVLERIEQMGISRNAFADQLVDGGMVDCHPLTIKRWLSDAPSGHRTISSAVLWGVLQGCDIEVKHRRRPRRR